MERSQINVADMRNLSHIIGSFLECADDFSHPLGALYIIHKILQFLQSNG